MAIGSIYATVPAVAAAVGMYFFEKNHSNTQGKVSGIQESIKNLVAKAKGEVITAPKLAPQFDGLYSFETLVGH